MIDSITITSDPGTDPGKVAPGVGEVTEKDGVSSVSVDTSKDKAEAPPAETAGERPSWLPEKFKSPEDLAKAYTELEKKQSQGGKKDEATPQDKNLTIPEAEKVAEKAGLDMDALAKEYAEKGGLADETYAKLEAAGLKRQQVDNYIKGQEALARELRQGLFSEAGGEEQFRSALQWAATNLSKAEQEAYNSMVDGGNIEGAKLAMRGLMSKYNASVGTEPRLVDGQGSSASAGTAPFGSNAEIVQAMRDPKYQTDAAYREMVSRRLAVTKMGGLG